MAEDPGASLAQLLKSLRVNAELTQEQLAEAAGVSARSVSDLERGINRTARRDTARLIADALGLSGAIRELFEATARGKTPADTQDEALVTAGTLPAAVTPLVGRAGDVQRSPRPAAPTRGAAGHPDRARRRRQDERGAGNRPRARSRIP